MNDIGVKMLIRGWSCLRLECILVYIISTKRLDKRFLAELLLYLCFLYCRYHRRHISQMCE